MLQLKIEDHPCLLSFLPKTWKLEYPGILEKGRASAILSEGGILVSAEPTCCNESTNAMSSLVDLVAKCNGRYWSWQLKWLMSTWRHVNSSKDKENIEVWITCLFTCQWLQIIDSWGICWKSIGGLSLKLSRPWSECPPQWHGRYWKR